MAERPSCQPDPGSVSSPVALTGLPLVTLHGCGEAHAPPGSVLEPRVLLNYELVWLITGEATCHLDGRDVTLRPGTLTLTRPGQRQGFAWTGPAGTRHVYVHFGVSRPADTWPAPSAWPVTLDPPEADVARPLLRHLQTWSSGHAAASAPTLAALLNAMLLGRSATTVHLPAWPLRVSCAADFIRHAIRRDPAAPVVLSAVAAHAGVTRAYLARAFHVHTGTTVMGFARALRLDLAADLLARSDLKVAQIATHVGYHDEFAFSRRFKIHTGLAPTRHRAARRRER